MSTQPPNERHRDEDEDDTGDDAVPGPSNADPEASSSTDNEGKGKGKGTKKPYDGTTTLENFEPSTYTDKHSKFKVNDYGTDFEIRQYDPNERPEKYKRPQPQPQDTAEDVAEDGAGVTSGSPEPEATSSDVRPVAVAVPRPKPAVQERIIHKKTKDSISKSIRKFRYPKVVDECPF